MEYGIDEQSRKRKWKRYKKKLSGGLTNFSSNVFSKGDILLENGYPGYYLQGTGPPHIQK
jgi:hypothetical protein